MIKLKEIINEIGDAVHQSPPAIIRQHDVNVSNNHNLTNSYIIAATVWGEAKGEGKEGMQAVLNVIMNRSEGNFTNAVKIATQHLYKSQKYQFSIWNGQTNITSKAMSIAGEQRNIAMILSRKNEYIKKLDELKKQITADKKNHTNNTEVLEQIQTIKTTLNYANKHLLDNQMYNVALELVDLAMKGQLPDITDGAIVYINSKYANTNFVNQVNAKMTNTVSIGNHAFYKNKPKEPKKK